MSAPVALLKTRLSVLCRLNLSPPMTRTLLGTTHRGRCPAGGRWMSQTGGNLQPLEGVRVLDLTRVLAGPFATMILGDLGAEVIKVERPGAGDDTRVWGPPFISSESVYFLSINRNKKSIAVDLKHPQGAKIIKELTSVCDVLVENFLPGKLQQLNLGFEQLIQVNPQIIFCSISGYGQTGPRSQSPGYDSIACAMSGMMHITGPEGGEPVRPGVAMTDLATGLYAHGAIMAALLQRQRTGRGVHIDCNLLSSQLTSVCDVLVENFLPGKLQQLNLGFEQLIQVNPQIIFCSISGYGQTGPRSQSPGYDSIACAMSGMMHITGPEGGEPVRPGVAMTDLATGLYAHGAIMAALLQRQRTGRGVHIDCNLLSSQVSCLSHIAANYLNAGKEARRWGTAHESIVPYQGFETRDGHIVVAAGNDKQFVKVCEVLELIQLNEDPRYKTNKLRVQNRKQLLHTLSQRFLQKNTADWLRSFEGSGVPVGPINSIQEVFSDPQVKHNNLIQEMNHPTAGRISVPGPAVRFSSFTPGGPTPPPLIGQHTVQVLRNTLSYSDDIIKELLECKAVVQNKVF